MTLQLQKITDLKTPQEKLIYRKLLNAIYSEITNVHSKRNFSIDRTRQHKIRISKLVINGKPNVKVLRWLKNSTKGDIVSIDDIPKDIIKQLKYGKILTKSQRKTLTMLRKINNKRTEKDLIKDFLINKNVLSVEDASKWIKNPVKYDLDGVDTIPKSVAGFVAGKINKLYGSTTKKHKYSRLPSSKKGLFTLPTSATASNTKRLIRINKLIKGKTTGQLTLAHEIGHSYDLLVKKMKKPSLNVLKDMEALAQKLNPPLISFTKWHILLKENKGHLNKLNKSVVNYMKYRLKPVELFADSFAYLVYDPVKVKKNYKSFYAYVVGLDKRLGKIISKQRTNYVIKLVKTIKKDKPFLKNESTKQKIMQIRKEILKIKHYKRIGVKRKAKIRSLELKIRNLRKF